MIVKQLSSHLISPHQSPAARCRERHYQKASIYRPARNIMSSTQSTASIATKATLCSTQSCGGQAWPVSDPSPIVRRSERACQVVDDSSEVYEFIYASAIASLPAASFSAALGCLRSSSFPPVPAAIRPTTARAAWPPGHISPALLPPALLQAQPSGLPGGAPGEPSALAVGHLFLTFGRLLPLVLVSIREPCHPTRAAQGGGKCTQRGVDARHCQCE